MVSLAAAVAGVATILAVVGSGPQIRRLWRTHDASGVALSTATIGIVSEAAWVRYTIEGGLWSAVPESVLATVVNVVLAGAVIRAGVPLARAAAGTVGWCAVLVAAELVGGPAALGVVLSVACAVQLAPAVWVAYRCGTPSGVSSGSWALVGIESVLWAVYGIAEGDVALLLLGIIGTAAAIAIVARVAAGAGTVELPDLSGIRSWA
jgi:uncharacterized protein with PQ loop repeat